ncbi:glutathione synthase [Pseudokordiimonas caeni]|uniref:glutathione synthase n=1 Tax=Pseudokordiimonas caeni TaxID=2997908 RepID=UPI002811412C|nr:glutathione synthase [Pseudokordiimonas caeni]
MNAAPLRVAIQMDPIETININGDSSFVLGLEALKRGYELYHYLPEALTYETGKVTATARRLDLRREAGNHYTLGDPVKLDLAEDIDVILMRQDPPFDMAYITATHLLGLIADRTLVVNNPDEVRNAPEKLFVTLFADLMPETMITRQLDDIREFRKKHGEIVIKPLYGMGGSGVFHLRQDDSNLTALYEMFVERNREPVMVQRFMPEVRHGDKRIILVDGKAAGALNRVPATGEIRSNLVAGGRAEKTELTAREQEICERIGPALYERGLVFVGIDVIGDWLTEINVTSPTGLQAIQKLGGPALWVDIWDAIEARLRGLGRL